LKSINLNINNNMSKIGQATRTLKHNFSENLHSGMHSVSSKKDVLFDKVCHNTTVLVRCSAVQCSAVQCSARRGDDDGEWVVSSKEGGGVYTFN
jgi:hypothetical protein